MLVRELVAAAQDDQMLLAILRGGSASLAHALDLGANPNLRVGPTYPLHLAALMTPDSEVIGQLLAWGADATSIDALGRTPVHYACLSNSSTTTIARFLTWGADPNMKDNMGLTPLDLA